MPGMKGTMGEFAAGTLHSGSKKGPVVKDRQQAIAIGLNQKRKAGERVPYHVKGEVPSLKGLGH